MLFQKVARGPSKAQDQGWRQALLVQALGGQWGQLEEEVKLVIFQTSQKADESNDSYLARHDNAFEDLMGAKVTVEDTRAYILSLSMDDRKKIIMENHGTPWGQVLQ